MKKFGIVLGFEYSNYIKSKGFIIITGILMLVVIVLSFIPRILTSFDEGVIIGEKNKAAIVLSPDVKKQGITQWLNSDVLNEKLGGFDWKEFDTADPGKLISEGKVNIAVSYDGGDNYSFYASGSDIMSLDYAYGIEPVITYAKRAMETAKLPKESQPAVKEIIDVTVSPNVIEVKGNATQNFIFAYVLIFFLYMTIIIYSQSIITSVVTEKSSRTMELLITSAKTSELMFGKIISVALVAMTQLLILTLTVALMVKINLSSWASQLPDLSSLFSSGRITLPLVIYFACYYILGYFLYAFIFAALGSTISRPEDAASVSFIPIMLIVAGLILAILSMTNPEAGQYVVLSYVPFFTPFILFGRICMGTAGTLEALLGIVDLAASVMLIGLLASKIYRTGVMMYGKALNIKAIARILTARK